MNFVPNCLAITKEYASYSAGEQQVLQLK